MRALFVCPFVPWPLDSGGRIRSFHLARQLSRRVELDLWAVREPGMPAGIERALEDACSALRLFDRAGAGPIRRLARPRIERWFHSPGLILALREAARGGRYDLIHLDELILARALPPAVDCAVVQHHHKLDLDLWRAIQPEPGGVRRFDLAKLSALERCAAERWRRHITCSEEDARRLLARHPHLECSAVPNGFDPDFFRLPSVPPPRERDLLVFVGSLDYAPNVEGLAWFAERVLPLVRRARPRARLEIVGRDPVREVRALAERAPGVLLAGPVPDVRPWLLRASAMAVPLRIGGGSRLKIAEALALACPVASTRVGAEGLALEDGVHLRLADEPQELARALVELLEDRRGARRLALEGRRRVRARYTWARLAGRVLASWEAALEAARVPSP